MGYVNAKKEREMTNKWTFPTYNMVLGLWERYRREVGERVQSSNMRKEGITGDGR